MDSGRIEIWGGIESTVCRIGNQYFDQTLRNGHQNRPEDLDRIASLGITHLRYPVLWERVAPDRPESTDWSWTDERLDRLRRLGVTPIVTLLHHGSGPRYTSLLDPEFPQKLARFAGAVAKRYPWLRYFTPVNEPLTTARFSAMYGWWYPHCRDEASFYRALLNQLAGIKAAMGAIRDVIPDAALVTTEDLGKTYATAPLQYQAEHENARRFLPYDLMCGRLDLNPRMREHLRHLGFAVDESFDRAYRCVPDVMGLNYYVTGERWLDHRLARYPEKLHGGNGRHRYVDVEAVRACVESIAGAGALLEEQWVRYRRPLAITEAHLACTREDQLRWLRDVYADLTGLKVRGADVRALTVWSLTGAYDWNSALTRQDGYYESGAFDVSSGSLRETAIAKYVRTLTAGAGDVHPAVEGNGWWRLPCRTQFAYSMRTEQPAPMPEFDRSRGLRRPIALLGGNDPVARTVREACRIRNLEFRVIEAGEDDDALAAYLKRSECWAAIDCTGADTAWDYDLEERSERLFRHFATVAHACRKSAVPLAAISSPLVFNGKLPNNSESARRNPVSVRGETYAEIEELLQIVAPRALIVRAGIPFGGSEGGSWHDLLLTRMLAGERVDVSPDDNSIVDRADLVRVLLDLTIDGERGIVHVANPGTANAMEILDAALRRARRGARIERIARAGKRRNYVLATDRVTTLPPKDIALARWVSALPNPLTISR